jgi:hypothetical protein
LGTKAIFVTEGEVVKQVFNRGDALLLQSLGDARANALNKLQRRFQSQ